MEDKQPMVLTIPQVAEKLGVSVSTAYTLAKCADFPSLRLTPHRIVVSYAGLEKWIEEQLDNKGGAV